MKLFKPLKIMTETYHINQGLNSILEVYGYILFGFLLSCLISLFFLRNQKKALKKSILINLFFYGSALVLYQYSINQNVNIAVFSRYRKEEPWLLFAFIASYIVLTSSQVLLFKKWTTKTTKIQLFISNLVFLILVLINSYPKPYVNENVIDYSRVLFVPNKKEFRLFDESIVVIDTACSSIIHYKNKRKNYGYSFRIPIRKEVSERMKFGFEILDSLNKSGASENRSNCKVLPIKIVKDDIVVLFKQKNPEKNIGWKKPIITDTIIFQKIRVEKREAGYYGDSNCDCIQH